MRVTRIRRAFWLSSSLTPVTLPDYTGQEVRRSSPASSSRHGLRVIDLRVFGLWTYLSPFVCTALGTLDFHAHPWVRRGLDVAEVLSRRTDLCRRCANGGQDPPAVTALRSDSRVVFRDNKMISKLRRYGEIVTVLARHGIGIVGDEFIKHEPGDRARAAHLRRACGESGRCS